MRLRERLIPKLTYEVCMYCLDWYGRKFVRYLYVGNDEPLSYVQIREGIDAWLQSGMNRKAKTVLYYKVSEPIAT